MGARSAPNVVTIAGINVETPVSVTGAGSPQIRINGGSWGTSGVITKNQTLEVRLTSATTDSTTRSADVTFRTVMESWNVRTIDTTPDTFSFTDVTLAAFNALTTSNTITISGIDTPTSVSVGGDGSPQVSINGGAWVTSGTIASGQSLAVHLTSASAGSTARSATVTVGGVSDNWSVTTKSTVVPGSQTFTSSGTIRERYDDGGFSGGTLERPGLKRLIQDVEAGLIDVIVVYKIDRLSRSLMDFARLVEIFDRSQVTFVSVTQSFNTTTSMGRLTLNILLSFAQFEREVIGERIRDKVAASRKRGMWMGGHVPLGYDVRDRKLVVNEAEAATVRMIFERFVAIGSATTLAKALAAEGVLNKRGKQIDKGFLYKLINNRLYLGEAVHKGTAYPGEHEAILDQALWDKVHGILQESPRRRAKNTRRQAPALLKGIIFTDTGTAMTPTATKKGTRLYRYYASMDLIRNRPTGDASGPLRLPAGMVEDAVVGEIRRMIRAPEIAARTIKALREESSIVDEKAVVKALGEFDQLWAALYPAEQTRIVQLLVERVTVGEDGIAVDLRHEGLGSVLRDMMAPRRTEACA